METTLDLRKWMNDQGLEDRWWVSVEGVSEEEPITVDEIHAFLSDFAYAHAQVLHAAEANETDRFWQRFSSGGGENAILDLGLVELVTSLVDGFGHGWHRIGGDILDEVTQVVGVVNDASVRAGVGFEVAISIELIIPKPYSLLTIANPLHLREST